MLIWKLTVEYELSKASVNQLLNWGNWNRGGVLKMEWWTNISNTSPRVHIYQKDSHFYTMEENKWLWDILTHTNSDLCSLADILSVRQFLVRPRKFIPQYFQLVLVCFRLCAFPCGVVMCQHFSGQEGYATISGGKNGNTWRLQSN